MKNFPSNRNSVERGLLAGCHLFLSLLAIMGAFVPGPVIATEKAKPDIVVVLCDDLNPFYTGFAGDPDAMTPNLDALAAESVVFTQCYTASPVCMSSRTAIVTGLYPHNTGAWGNANELFVPPKLTSLFSDLKATGYATSVIGKTHWFAGRGFRSQFDSLDDYYEGIGVDHIREVATTFSSRNGKGRYQDFLQEIGKFEAQSADLTERLATNQYVARKSLLKPDESCDWMMTDLALKYFSNAPTDEPFAMMVGFSNPHSPFDPAGKYADLYEPESLHLRANVSPFKKYGTDYDLAEIRKARAAYLGKISFIDDLLGKLVTAIKERGNWDNTVLVFTADHGMAVGEHRNIAKGQFWEEVSRVPMVMRIPGITAEGMSSDALCQTIDLYPTLIELAGGVTAPHVLGRSLAPIIAGETDSVRDAVFSEIQHDGILDYMVRTDRYKWFTDKGREELYDLGDDPFEQTNLIDLEEHHKVSDQMRDRLRTFLMTEQVNHAAGYEPMAERVKKANESRPPNVVLILADDLGYEDLGVQGSPDIPTPNLDSIATNGIRCTNAYITAPVCSPSRAGLLTGRYQNRFGFEYLAAEVTTGPPDRAVGLDVEELTIGDRMKALGYVTGCVGKWHLGKDEEFFPTRRGFDEFYGTLGQSSYYAPVLFDSRKGSKSHKVEEEGYYVTDDYTKRAVEFVHDHKDKPFFLYLSHFAVHKPHDATEKYLARFPRIEDPMRRSYAAMTSALDDGVGLVLDALRENGLEEDTLIVFLSDNGGTQGSSNIPLRGKKGGTWEGGIKTPLLIQWKGQLAAGATYDEPVISLDLLPTFISAAGGKNRSDWNLDGSDLLPYFDGRAEGAPHDALFWRFGTQWAVRKGEWKLLQAREGKTGSIQIAAEGPVRLFNLKEDISEENDLAADNPEVVKELQAKWDEWAAQLPEPAWYPADKN